VKLRTRVTAFFLLAALPAGLISAGAVVILDRLIQGEIRQRADDTFTATERVIDLEEERIARALERLGEMDAVQNLAAAVEHESALDNADTLAAPLAATLGLDLLALVAARGPREGTIVASAHLPTAAGDPAPSFARVRSATSAPSPGFAHELVAGNPPAPAPALLAIRPILDRNGRPALIAYGGIRLDTQFLDAAARMGGATLVLEAPGFSAKRFPIARASGDDSDPRRVRSMSLRVLEGARLEGAPDETGIRGPRISVAVDVGRLEHARGRFAVLAAGLGVSALALALLAGAWISRRIAEPILDLSRAAAEVGAGRLDRRVPAGGNDEVGALIAVFNQMVAEIADARERLARTERVAAWREAARRIAHEIKNPLNPMQMAMQTLRKAYQVKHADLDAILDESTRVVLDEVREISRLVSGFSEFARLPRPKIEAVAPLSLLEHAARLYGTPPAGVEVALDKEALGARGLHEVAADPAQIERALINLVKNAIEAFGARGGRVVLDAETARRGSADGVSLSVRDDGPGMSAEIREQLFVPYFTTKAEGTGLGLAIVERIIADHEGAIDVETAPGKGSTFRLWLPAAPDERA
jgi:signal transduction histidine kinase